MSLSFSIGPIFVNATFFKLGTNVLNDTTMNWLELCGQSSKSNNHYKT